MLEFVKQLKQEGVFAKEVQTGGMAFHSYFMDAIAPTLLQQLKKVGGCPRAVQQGPALRSGGEGRPQFPQADPAHPCAQVIREPQLRSPRWLSTSIPESQWHESLARTFSAEYNVNNLVSPVLFQEALWHVPENAVVLEIAPHALLQVRVVPKGRQAGRAQGAERGASGHWSGGGPACLYLCRPS